jgi:hypothetical protein
VIYVWTNHKHANLICTYLPPILFGSLFGRLNVVLTHLFIYSCDHQQTLALGHISPRHHQVQVAFVPRAVPLHAIQHSRHEGCDHQIYLAV